MISKKIWIHAGSHKIGAREWVREGWYLFGFIPLYTRDVGPRKRRMPKLKKRKS